MEGEASEGSARVSSARYPPSVSIDAADDARGSRGEGEGVTEGDELSTPTTAELSGDGLAGLKGCGRG